MESKQRPSDSRLKSVVDPKLRVTLESRKRERRSGAVRLSPDDVTSACPQRQKRAKGLWDTSDKLWKLARSAVTHIHIWKNVSCIKRLAEHLKCHVQEIRILITRLVEVRVRPLYGRACVRSMEIHLAVVLERFD